MRPEWHNTLMPQKRNPQRPGAPTPRAQSRPTVAPQGRHGAAPPDEGKTISLWDGTDVTITRRHLIYGAVGIGALALLGGGSYAYDRFFGDDGASEVLEVPEGAVFSTDDCQLIDDASSAVRLVSQRKLPFGTVVHASDDALAACLLPTDTASPLCQVGLIDLGSGSLATVLKDALGADDGFQIYDVRANAAGIVWVEANIMKRLWRVHAAPLAGTELGATSLVAQGDGAWEMPALAVAGSYAFWQEVPRADGELTDEPSRLMRAAFATGSPEELYTSKAPMLTPPCSNGTGITITPRAERGTSYCQLTHLDAATGQTADALVLPSSMAPLEASFGPTGFSFAFDGIYDYGDGIANLGTYVPVTLPGSNLAGTSAAAAYDGVEWFRFARAPIASPAWCGPWFMMRSTSAVCGVDLANRRYFQIPVENGATDYGDMLASTGAGSRVATFSNVDYTPLNGERERHTLLRVWEAV